MCVSEEDYGIQDEFENGEEQTKKNDSVRVEKFTANVENFLEILVEEEGKKEVDEGEDEDELIDSDYEPSDDEIVVDKGKSPNNVTQKIKKTDKDIMSLILSVTWRIQCSRLVKTLNNTHTCGRVFKNKNVTAKWLAEKFEKKWKTDPYWSRASFAQEVRDTTVGDVSLSIYYRARKLALKKIYGSLKEQYSLLWDYCEELKTSNPGTTVFMQCNSEKGYPEFERLYVCLAACKLGFLAGCRPLVGLDGCHIKGHHQGQLLAAVGIDGNNSFFPVAYAVVESENKDSWNWFLGFLKDDLNIQDNSRIFWMSDKQKGLIEAIKICFEGSAHRFCVRHLYNHFKKEFKGLVLKQVVWRAARATTIHRFEAEMEKLKGLNVDAYKWLDAKDPKTWTRSHFQPNPICDMLLNNMCESFNSAILEARDKPILTLLETIRRYIMVRLVMKKESISKWNHDIAPRIFKILENNKSHALQCIPEYCGDGKFEVRCYFGDRYCVDLNTKTCSCRRWQLTGIPCSHGISCMEDRDINPELLVHECYNKTTYLKIYGYVVNPLNDPEAWRKTSLDPPRAPPFRTLPGRPKKLRTMEPGEVEVPGGRTVKMRRVQEVKTCSICGKQNHNKKGCPKREQQPPIESKSITTIKKKKENKKDKMRRDIGIKVLDKHTGTSKEKREGNEKEKNKENVI
ncbi:uncharacterized protein LOC133831059 [Humulus lupulus]|uniref:uncharacterized protein LOC133831059 n=1 Tax=Humulus lupulus TaxID=3486 RepID=UPI002B4077E6|nr:uncharacterized protein LOC133831059 [Humulus lupulus]